MADSVHEIYRDQVGWEEMVETINDVYQDLPEAEKAQTGIVAGNYGETRAINLYGPQHGLPQAISAINTYWLRGYGDPPPQTVIVVGYSQDDVNYSFETCELVAEVTNHYGVANEETSDYPGVFVCRGLRKPWSELWKEMKHFG